MLLSDDQHGSVEGSESEAEVRMADGNETNEVSNARSCACICISSQYSQKGATKHYSCKSTVTPSCGSPVVMDYSDTMSYTLSPFPYFRT